MVISSIVNIQPTLSICNVEAVQAEREVSEEISSCAPWMKPTDGFVGFDKRQRYRGYCRHNLAHGYIYI